MLLKILLFIRFGHGVTDELLVAGELFDVCLGARYTTLLQICVFLKFCLKNGIYTAVMLQQTDLIDEVLRIF
jgi:hypothetical protein